MTYGHDRRVRAGLMFRMADRRMSCGTLPGTPAALQASSHALEVKLPSPPAEIRGMSTGNRPTRRGIVSALSRNVPAWLTLAVDLIGLGLIAMWLHGFVYRNALFQGDLLAYRYAGEAAVQGLDPYVPENLARVAGRRIYPFVYPPITLLPCMAIADLPLKAVKYTWMWSKIAVLGLLILGWSRLLDRRIMLLPLGLAAVFGWNSSAQWDLTTGNITIVEAAVVWLAMSAYMRGSRWLFSILVVGIALFKIAPAAFLLLLLVPTQKQHPSPRLFAASAIAVLLLIAVPMLVGPAAHFRFFWRAIPNWTVPGVDNPSLIGFATTTAAMLPLHGIAPARFGVIVWVLFCVGLLVASAPLLRDCYRSRDAKTWAMVAVFLYILIMPRPMAYGFVMLTPAALWFAPRPFNSGVGRVLLALIISTPGLFRVTYIFSPSPLAWYAPPLLALCIWALVLNQRHEDQRTGVPERSAELGAAKAA